MPAAEDHPLSILVMTYNEEANIERCLQSTDGLGDEILVLDSFSTDQTVELAKRFGARVEQFPFDSYIHQKERMIQMAKHDWVLSIDADEYLSPELKTSIQKAKSDHSFDGYTSNRRNKMGDRWMKYGSWYPDRKIRFFDRRKVSIIGNDPHDVMQPIANVRIGHLEGDLMHLSDENISSRYKTIEKHSTRAAEALFANGIRSNLFRILVKPFLRFIGAYVFKLGLLDGYYGWIVAKSEGHYVWLREVKLCELWDHGSKNKDQKTKINN
ncbi:MAG: glycosyltransferase family 2 protein [Saprospiraceae bacterium]